MIFTGFFSKLRGDVLKDIVSLLSETFASTLARGAVFWISLLFGTFLGEYILNVRFESFFTVFFGMFFHILVAVAQFWGILILLLLGWIFYVMFWKDASVLLSAIAVVSLQYSVVTHFSLFVFTPNWIRHMDDTVWIVIFGIVAVICFLTSFVMLNWSLGLGRR